MTGHAFIRRAILLFCSFTLTLNVLLLPSQANAAATKSAPKPAVKRIANGVQLTSGYLNVKVQFYSNDTVRVLKWTAGGTPNKNSLSVIQKDVPALKVRCEKNADSITLSSSSIKVQIAKNDGSVRFLATDGHIVLQEGTASLAPSKVEKGAFALQQNFALTPEEGVYGLGQHQYGDMNYRGKTAKLVQANRNSASPFFVSTAGYGIFWDNYAETIFSDDRKTTSFWSEVGDNIDYYFFYGPSMDQVIAGYRHLTGEAPLYGKWAYGYWQSKEHYASRDELLSIAKEFRTRQIPIDNIVQDWQYWGGNENWSGMFFDE
jgi:alpha-D-xyloside xylohydrolase